MSATEIAPMPKPVPPARRDPASLPSVSVVMPAFNESAIIVESLTQVHEYMHTLDDRYRWEILVVDDGSGDATGELAEAFAGAHDHVRVLRHRVNFRLGQALRFAFNQSKADYVVTFDCDLSYSPDHIGRLLFAIEDTQARIVIASPYAPEGKTTAVPWLRRKSSRWANRLLGLSAKGQLTTLTGMVRAYDRVFLSSLNLKAMDTEINTEIIYKAQLLRARIEEIPAHLDWTFQLKRKEQGRSSSIHMSRSTLSSVFLAFIFRPFMFFILPGIVVSALAAWMILWIVISVVQDFVGGHGGWDAQFSHALDHAYRTGAYRFVVGGVALLVGIQLVSLGIMSLQAKRYFEELFHLGSNVLRRLPPPADG